MAQNLLKNIFFLFIGVFLFTSKTYAEEIDDEGHMVVVMRLVGHHVLLDHGDSNSRVLPIKKENNHYRIQFESQFEFNPGALVATIDSAMKSAKVKNGYRVEVEQCKTSDIIYSYEVGDTSTSDLMTCWPRNQPLDCYSLLITILKKEGPIGIANQAEIHPVIDPNTEKDGNNSLPILVFIALMLILALLLYQLRKKRQNKLENSDTILIGEYRFDTRNMMLSIGQTSIELTGKEADLLNLLHSSANTTLEREAILKVVWGDEGDYIGRTLDVFISKLRKKLESDPNVKITNIRGIGYKLVLNEPS
mgnify:CR=1 FL=1